MKRAIETGASGKASVFIITKKITVSCFSLPSVLMLSQEWSTMQIMMSGRVKRHQKKFK